MQESPDEVKTAISLETQPGFNWKNCWYAVSFTKDLPQDRPYRFSLYDEPLVLFRNLEGKSICLKDICPHRAAKLSDGQIIDGKIECLYHGWQFGMDGKCLHIPQLPSDVKIPAAACVQAYKTAERQGIIWMWAGQPEEADEKDIPTASNLDNPRVASSDYMRDLPYDLTFFIENALDPSHLFISHNGTLKNRKNAQPLEMEILKISHEGIEGRYRTTKNPNQNWVALNFIAPNVVTYDTSTSKRIGGAVLYCLPLGKNRCRIIIRNYNDSSTWKIKLQPRWLEHWYRNKFLEEDLPLVIGQQTQVNSSKKTLKELYLPLKTSDLILLEYRKWLDRYGLLLPSYQGWEMSPNITSQEASFDRGNRLESHTEICGSCRQAYKVTKHLKQILVGLSIGLAALGLVLGNSWIQVFVVLTSLFALLLAVLAGKIIIKFEQSHTRY